MQCHATREIVEQDTQTICITVTKSPDFGPSPRQRLSTLSGLDFRRQAPPHRRAGRPAPSVGDRNVGAPGGGVPLGAAPGFEALLP
jgi:hypothetical protein